MKNDNNIFRPLGSMLSEISSSQKQKEKVMMWKALNGLNQVKPMALMYQIPWNEINDDFLIPLSTEPYLKTIELYLRKVIYQYNHMACDMIVPDFIPCPMIINDTGFGIESLCKRSRSAKYEPQIKNSDDIEKIKNPVVTYDFDLTKRYHAYLCEIFDGILPVKIVPAHRCLWYAPWDLLVTLLGVQQSLEDLILRPLFIHQAMKRVTDAYHARLDQYEQLNLLMHNNDDLFCSANEQFVGSGGYGFSDELPIHGSSPVRTKDLWGCASAQIFSDVSPEMHEEFSLNYDMSWLNRFRFSYYGCCEPLENKIYILKKISNLRKISISPWVRNYTKAAECIGSRYVYSYKPNPSIFAYDQWDITVAKKDIVHVLESTYKYNCNLEVIMKDISTIRMQPERLWEWSKMVNDLLLQYT